MLVAAEILDRLFEAGGVCLTVRTSWWSFPAPPWAILLTLLERTRRRSWLFFAVGRSLSIGAQDGLMLSARADRTSGET